MVHAASALLRELPWVAGTWGGISLIQARGGAFRLDGIPEGIQWFDYVSLAWHLVHQVPGGGEDWRRPTYFLLLGHLGEDLGYVDAGILIASVSMALAVVAAALAGRALAGPAAGGLAAFGLALVETVQDASRWVTFYPPLAAAVGLAFACGALLARWPGLLLSLATGLAAGGAWALDLRGAMALPVGAALVAIAMLAAPTQPGRWSRIRRWLLPLPFLVGILPALGATRRPDIHMRPLGEQVYLQREVGLQWVRETGDRALSDACRSEPPREAPSVAALIRPCAREMVRYNFENRLQDHAPFPLLVLLAALPLALLPGDGIFGAAGRPVRSALRASLASLSIFGGVAAPLLFQALWLPLPERYLLPFVVPLALLLPVALERTLRTVLPRRIATWAALGAAAVAGGLTWWNHPWNRVGAEVPVMDQTRLAARVAADLRPLLGPDDVFLDCTAYPIQPALLPLVRDPVLRAVSHVDPQVCRAFLADPRAVTTGRGIMRVATSPAASPAVLGFQGWTRERSWGADSLQVELWRAVEPVGP